MQAGIPLDAPVKGRPLPPIKAARKGSSNLVKGVVRNDCTDGYGRRASYYVAEDGAKLCASLQRLLWIIENGRWNPSDGDPLAIMSYADSFSGNAEYDDCVIDDVSSPYLREYANKY